MTDQELNDIIQCAKRLIAEEDKTILRLAQALQAERKEHNVLCDRLDAYKEALQTTRQSYLNVVQHHIQEDCTCKNCMAVINSGILLKTE